MGLLWWYIIINGIGSTWLFPRFLHPVIRTGWPEDESHIHNYSVPGQNNSEVKNQALIFTDSTGSKWSMRISSASTFYTWGKYFLANSSNSVQNQKSSQSAFVDASDSLLMHSSTFWSLFIFCWRSTWEPASVTCDSWQGDPFCSSGPHGKQHCHN